MGWVVGEVDGVVIKQRSIIGTAEWGAAKDTMIELMAAQLSDRLDMGESIADSFADGGDVSGGVCTSGYIKNDETVAVAAVEAHTGTDQTGSGSVSASSIYNTSYYAAYAFDNNPTGTSWIPSGSTPCWLKYDFGSVATIGKYTITAATAGVAGNPDSAPSAWTFQGSSDDSNWTTLDTRSGISWSTAETKTFNFSEASYRYFRIYITADGGYGQIAIGEMELCDADIAYKAAVPASIDPTVITVTPYTPESTLEKVRVTLMVEDSNNSGAIALGDAATDLLQVYLSYDGNSSFGSALAFSEEAYQLTEGSNIYVFNSDDVDVSGESIASLGMKLQSFDRGAGAPEFRFHAYIIAGKELVNE